MSSLQGTVAIVTGGGSGIGEATARVLAERGANVMVADVNDETGRATVARIAEAGGVAAFQQCDVSRTHDVEQMVRETVARFGRLDALVANAGIQVGKPLVDTSDDEWDRVMDINLKGTFLCCRAAIPEMRKAGGGVIVATGSVLSFIAEPNLAAYCASKGGIMLLIRSIATDYGRYGIRANAVCPGYINTPLGDEYFETQADPAAAKRAAEQLHLVERLGETDEVATCIAFLLSKDASFMTGSALVVDGGLMAKV